MKRTNKYNIDRYRYLKKINRNIGLGLSGYVHFTSNIVKFKIVLNIITAQLQSHNHLLTNKNAFGYRNDPYRNSLYVLVE